MFSGHVGVSFENTSQTFFSKNEKFCKSIQFFKKQFFGPKCSPEKQKSVLRTPLFVRNCTFGAKRELFASQGAQVFLEVFDNFIFQPFLLHHRRKIQRRCCHSRLIYTSLHTDSWLILIVRSQKFGVVIRLSTDNRGVPHGLFKVDQ